MDIDFVVLWVDGNDPQWQAQKAKYQGKTLDDSNAAHRFRDWGLMPYWFRAVEKFCPWVRKVHFVTCGHVPQWLNLDCPKLNHVKHSDYTSGADAGSRCVVRQFWNTGRNPRRTGQRTDPFRCC